MKKRNFKSLALNKKMIVVMGARVKGGRPTFSEVVKCKFNPVSDPLKPIPDDTNGSCHPCPTIYSCTC
ncbi:hypothetical protein [Kordia sp.]|uniref:hypothetical protein n=1 Tax=Kordia sp. TaxID=1965332 RepID=UPI003B5C05F3